MKFYTYIKRPLGSFIAFILIGIAVLNIWFYLLQPSMLFYPYKQLEAVPSDWGLAYENVSLKTADNVLLHGWYIPNKISRHVVLFFHGNGGNISHRGDSLKIFHQLGLNVLILDYRGYGLSEGRTNEQGIYHDAKAAWQYLLERGYTADDIIIFGRSLGGAVAIQLASQTKPAALIVESTFSSVSDMAHTMIPLISHLIYFRFSFDSVSRIAGVKVPLLMLHSPEDEIIPYQLGQKVFSAANAPKYFYELRGGHNEGFVQSMPGYQQMLRTFIDREIMSKDNNNY